MKFNSGGGYVGISCSDSVRALAFRFFKHDTHDTNLETETETLDIQLRIAMSDNQEEILLWGLCGSIVVVFAKVSGIPKLLGR